MTDRRVWLTAILLLAGCQPAHQPPTAEVAAPPPAVNLARSDACRDGTTSMTVAGDRGIGGTGINNSDGLAERGIGGTGISAPGGIGGTGLGGGSLVLRGLPKAERGGGGTGIYGVITGFRSICIDGLEVAADQPAHLTVDGVARETETLRVGDVAEIDARGLTTSLHAVNIAVRHEVSGQVTQIAGGGRELDVAGQQVVLGPQTKVDADLRPGAWVQVSGLRDAAGAIHASRVDDRAPGEIVVAGIPVRSGARWMLGALPLDFDHAPALVRPGRLRPDQVRPGERIVVAGDYASGALRVTALNDDPLVPPPGTDHEFVVEGFSSFAGGQLHLSDGLQANVGPAFGATPPGDQPIVLELMTQPDNSLLAVGWHEMRGAVGGGGAPSKTPATPPAVPATPAPDPAVAPSSSVAPPSTSAVTSAASDPAQGGTAPANAGGTAPTASGGTAALGSAHPTAGPTVGGGTTTAGGLGATGAPAGPTGGTAAAGGGTTAPPAGAIGIGAGSIGRTPATTISEGHPTPPGSLGSGKPTGPTTAGTVGGGVAAGTTAGSTTAGSGGTGAKGTGSTGAGSTSTGFAAGKAGTGSTATGSAGTGSIGTGSTGESSMSADGGSDGGSTGGSRGRGTVTGKPASSHLGGGPATHGTPSRS